MAWGGVVVYCVVDGSVFRKQTWALGASTKACHHGTKASSCHHGLSILAWYHARASEERKKCVCKAEVPMSARKPLRAPNQKLPGVSGALSLFLHAPLVLCARPHAHPPAHVERRAAAVGNRATSAPLHVAPLSPTASPSSSPAVASFLHLTPRPTPTNKPTAHPHTH